MNYDASTTLRKLRSRIDASNYFSPDLFPESYGFCTVPEGPVPKDKENHVFLSSCGGCIVVHTLVQPPPQIIPKDFMMEDKEEKVKKKVDKTTNGHLSAVKNNNPISISKGNKVLNVKH